MACCLAAAFRFDKAPLALTNLNAPSYNLLRTDLRGCPTSSWSMTAVRSLGWELQILGITALGVKPSSTSQPATWAGTS